MQVGIDIGGTTVSVGIVSDQGAVVRRAQMETRWQQGADTVIDRMCALLDGLLCKQTGAAQPITHIGVGCAGKIDREQGAVVYSNNIGWNNVPLGKRLRDTYHLPVYVDNDAICATLGEFDAGVGKRFDSMLMVTIGTGIGGGLILNKKLYNGYHGFANIIGHIVIDKNGPVCSCGRRGCFELYGSTTALVQRAQTMAAEQPDSLLAQQLSAQGANGRSVFSAIRQNDSAALAVFEEYTTNLSIGLANLVNCLNPQSVVLSGGLCREGEFLIAPLRKKVAAQLYCGESALPEILPAALLDDAGMIGAAMLPKYR